MASGTTASRLRSALTGDLQILMYGNGIEAAMRFGAFVLYSHALGPAGVGIVASVLALTRLASQLLEFGIDTSVISLGSKEFGRGDAAATARVCQAGFLLHVAIGTLLAICGAAASPWLAARYLEDPSLAPALALAFAGTIVLRLADFSVSVLRTYQKFRAFAAAGVVAAAVLLVSVGGLAWTGRLGVPIVLALVTFVTPAVRLSTAVAGVPAGILRLARPSAPLLRDLVRFGKWIYGTSLAEGGMRRINVLLLQALAGSTAAGYFHAATRYADFLSLVFEPLRKYLVPKFTALPDARSVRAALKETYSWLAWTLLLLPAAWLLSGPVILGVQGAEWREAVLVFRILVVAALAMLLAKPLTYALFSVRRPEIQTVVQVALFVAFVAAAPMIIRRWGAVGSAWAILGVALAGGLWLAVYVRRVLRAEAARVS